MPQRVSRILGPDGQPYRHEQPAAPSRRVRARYDAAQTTPENRRHWNNADGMSARSANSPAVRYTLRNRSRYEFDNSGYFHGLILTLANDLIGTGPTLQVVMPDDDEASDAFAEQVEAAFAEWADAIGLADKLQTMTQSKVRDGEAFALLINNERLPTSVKLDLLPIEAEQVATGDPAFVPSDGAFWVDGIEFDAARNPIVYHVLKDHPGDLLQWSTPFDRVAASKVIHWFRADRAGQARGIPELTCSLPLGAQMRRWTLSTLMASETAANYSAMLETEADADGDTDDPTPFESLEIERNMLTTLPRGSKLHQMEAEQPTTTYPQFKQELLKELGRPANAPYNVVAGDSGPYNYSSAKLDLRLYDGANRVVRNHCRRIVLLRIWHAFVDEAVMIPGLLPAEPPGVSYHSLPIAWFFPGSQTIDPKKDADADTVNLGNGTTTLAEIYAEEGQDWKARLRQRAKEIRTMKKLGIPLPAWASGAAAPAPAQDANQTDPANADSQAA